jgi:RimJ/RimL family protein N-acetyltransferase
VPNVELHSSWLEAHAEWGPGLHEDGFGLEPADETSTPSGFAAWIGRLRADAHCTYRWILENGQVLGGIALRHPTHPFVPLGGHIGYGIRPSARGRGWATWALGRMLEKARCMGMERVLAVCEAGNIASAKTIERLGGERELPDDGAEWRYWISLGERANERDRLTTHG